MTGVITGLAGLQDILRVVLLWAALAVAAVAATDWLVRTRRLSPFGTIARTFRRYVDPLLAPVERRVVRAGGLPQSAAWWALAAIIVGGLLLLALLGFLESLVDGAARGLSGGPIGLVSVLLSWAFGILQLAILVRVIVSWLPVSPYSKWVRWSFTLSEPILRPLRRIIPTFGAIDISPIVAFFLISIVGNLVVGLLRGLA